MKGSHKTASSKELGKEHGLRQRLARFFVNIKGSTMTGNLDVGSTIRSTGATTPASGEGIEIYYSTDVGYILVYDRTGSTYEGLSLYGDTIKLLPQGGTVQIGGAANYTSHAANGDQSFVGTAGFYPRVLNQSAAPAAGTGATQCDTGEFVIWEDSDNTETWLVYNRGGTVKGIKVETL